MFVFVFLHNSHLILITGEESEAYKKINQLSQSTFKPGNSFKEDKPTLSQSTFKAENSRKVLSKHKSWCFKILMQVNSIGLATASARDRDNYIIKVKKKKKKKKKNVRERVGSMDEEPQVRGCYNNC